MELSSDQVNPWRELLESRKKLLLKEKDNLRDQVRSTLTADASGEISKIRLHSADLATDAQEFETIESLSLKNLVALQEIEGALARLDNGVYGICSSCEEHIPEARLRVMPESRFCLDCQKDFEKSRRVTPAEVFPRGKGLSATLMKSLEALNQVKVSDIMRESPFSAHVNETLEVVARILAEQNIRHIPIVDSRGDIQGIVSDRDLLDEATKARSWKVKLSGKSFWRPGRVSEIMSKVPETVSPDTSIKDAGRILLDYKINCLPVVEGNRLIGIITSTDFVKLVSQGV